MRIIYEDGRFMCDLYHSKNQDKFIQKVKEKFQENRDRITVTKNTIIISTSNRNKFIKFCEEWLTEEIKEGFNTDINEPTEVYSDELYDDFKEMLERVNKFYYKMCMDKGGILIEKYC